MNLSDIHFYKGTYAECFEICTKEINSATTLIVTPNPEMLYAASKDSQLLEILKSSDYALPDGIGIFVAYQIVESTLPSWIKWILLPVWCCRAIVHGSSFVEKYGERITGSRLTRDLMSYAAEMGIPVTIIDPVVTGESEGDKKKRASQETMKEKLEEKFPGIICQVIVADTTTELFHQSTNPPIHGITFTTHGNGKQEKLLAEMREKFPQSGILIGVGGSIDLLTGFRQPAPRFFQRFGGEWLYRLYKNPSRHWKRMRKVVKFILGQF